MPEIDLALLERFGGWIVVIWIVSWMRSSITRLIDAAEKNMMEALKEFQAFRLQEAEQHKALEDLQDEILQQIRSIR